MTAGGVDFRCSHCGEGLMLDEPFGLAVHYAARHPVTDGREHAAHYQEDAAALAKKLGEPSPSPYGRPPFDGPRFLEEEMRSAAVAIMGLDRVYSSLLSRENRHDADRLAVAILEVKRVFNGQADKGQRCGACGGFMPPGVEAEHTPALCLQMQNLVALRALQTTMADVCEQLKRFI